jgi:hypothetical protein
VSRPPVTSAFEASGNIASSATAGNGISLSDPNPQKWDQLLLGTWYVPAANLLAYLVEGGDSTPQPVADQTIFQITSAQNGDFSGQNSVQLSIPSPVGLLQPGATSYTMSGVVSPAGQVRIQFTPTSSNRAPVTGVGAMEFVDGAWRMTMQMASGTSAFLTHWAFMTKLAPGETPPPAVGPAPLGLRSWEWSWLQSSRWGITDSQVLGGSGGVFQIDGYHSGYFWGSGAGSTSFSVDGSVTPEGNLFLVLTPAGGTPVTRTGVLQQSADGLWHMVFHAYEGQPAAGTALLLSLLSPSQLFVTHLYEDILHRLPDLVGLVGWSAQVDHGLNRSVVAYSIEQSLEARIDQVQDLYQAYLGRPADALGLTTWVWFLNQGGTLVQVQSGILGSPEYYQVQGGGMPAGFVTAVYDDVFHRQPDPAGTAFWVQALAQGLTRAALASLVISSPEGAADRTTRLYAGILERQPDPIGGAFLANALEVGLSDEAAIAYLAGSPEYFDR